MTQEMTRHRYGDSSLWVLEENLGGTRAGRLLEHLDQHFGNGGEQLLLDLRSSSFIDSAGARALIAAFMSRIALPALAKIR